MSDGRINQNAGDEEEAEEEKKGPLGPASRIPTEKRPYRGIIYI